MNKPIKVLALTGIRSEYDILYPVLDELRRDKNIQLKLVVSGAHLSPWHGQTLNQIRKDGFEISDEIDSLIFTDRDTQRVKGIGMLLMGLAQTIERERPDFLVVVGDREESIAAALAANYMNVLLIHIGGGDPVFGNSDDPIRFAVSKLAHIHCTTTKSYAQNLLTIGEEDFRVFFTGNPSLDNIRQVPEISIEEINRHLQWDLKAKGFIVLIKHPLSSQANLSHEHMSITLKSLEKFCRQNELKTIGIFPNTDPGSAEIVRVIEGWKGNEYIRFYRTLPREIFVNLMRQALALAGNSSMGILEAPFYHLPVVNIGDRQQGRLNAGNVEFVKHDLLEIEKALQKACFDHSYRKFIESLDDIYGDGHSAAKIKDILFSINRNEEKWYIKRKLC